MMQEHEIKSKPFHFFAVMSAMLSACANPAAVVKSEAERFKTEYPDHIQKFQFQSRTLQYAWNGDPAKPAILFIHGSPGSWEGWAHFLLDPHLKSNFHLISIDRPGYGGSGEGQTEVSVETQAEAIFEVLKFNHSARPAILVGHSFGGPVIAKIAMLHPERIGGLVFVASSVSPDLEKTKWFQTPATWWPIRVFIPNSLRVCNEEILPLKGELIKMLPDWKKITAKSVLIQGEQDTLVPPGNQDFLVQNLPKGSILKVVRIEALNHFVPWKRPDLIFDAIQELEPLIK